MRGADTDPWSITLTVASAWSDGPGIREPDSSKAKSTRCLSWWYYPVEWSGDTENLLAQKLPILSSRLIEQLKYWEASGSGPKRQATSDKQHATKCTI